MSIWIKICGLTATAAVDSCLDAGVDAIGFVFAESVRNVTAEQAVRLTAGVRNRALRVAVMRHPTQQAVDEIVEVFKPDLLQTDAEDLEMLSLPRHLQVLPVLRREVTADEALPARLLFEGPTSGGGALSDWAGARRIARRAELILAGGLNARNVGAAIAAVDPFGVDVSSGVEDEPGIKSLEEIARFVSAARSASAAESTKEMT